jgi:hypothetical protein
MYVWHASTLTICPEGGALSLDIVLRKDTWNLSIADAVSQLTAWIYKARPVMY